MDENEYLAQFLVRERLREAEARGALRMMLREARERADARRREASDDRARPGRFGLWWHVMVARAAHLSLSKLGNWL